MSRRFAQLGVVVIVAAVTHVGLVLAVPHVLTRIAAERISQKGSLQNRWIYPPRATERSREIVRPSPDLAYAACVYDLHNGPVRITVTPGATYTSLTLYAPNTDTTVIDTTKPVDLVIARHDQLLADGPWRVIRTADQWGIALQRRLAPTAEAFTAADGLRRTHRCEQSPILLLRTRDAEDY